MASDKICGALGPQIIEEINKEKKLRPTKGNTEDVVLKIMQVPILFMVGFYFRKVRNPTF